MAITTNLPVPLSCRARDVSSFAVPLFVFFLFNALPVNSQPENDGEELKEAVDFAINTLPKSQLGLYNGPDYTPSTITAGGHPYFLHNEFVPGTITFDGITYSDIDLLFDASRQKVVIEDFSGNRICPVDERIQKFTVGTHTFQRIPETQNLPPGFYDVIIEGKLFAMRSKSVRAMQWKNSNVYYFFNEGRIFKLENKKTVLLSMADQENEIRRHIRMNKLSFARDIESSLSDVVNYYSSLKHQ